VAGRGKKKQRPHRPHDLGPRVYREPGSRWFKIDLRPWGLPRMTLRDPEAPGWPDRGARTESQETAEQWKWEYLGDIHRGERRRVLSLGPEPRRLGEAVDAFLAHRRATVERATFINSRSAAVHLLEAFGRIRLTSTVEGAHLQELVTELLDRGYEPTTLDTYVRSWRLFFEWCHFGMCGVKLRTSVSRRRLAEFYDPTEGVTLPKPGRVDVITLSDAEIPEVMRAARKVDAQQIGFFPSAYRACGIGLFMGLRQGEIFALDASAIDARTKTVRVQFQVQKDRSELVPTKGKNARTAVVLDEWWEQHDPSAIGLLLGRNGKPVSTRPQRNLITRVLDTAGLNEMGLGWHLLRHTYARLFLERGGAIGFLQKSLGHSSVRTTEAAYEHLQTDVAARLAHEQMSRA
jgi:integrase